MSPEPKQRQVFFYILLLTTSVLAAVVLRNFFSVIILSTIYSFAIKPLFNIFHKYLKSESLASLLTLLISILILFLPIVLVVNLFIMEALSFRESVVYESGSFTQAVEQQIRSSANLFNNIPFAKQIIHPESISQWIEQSAQSISKFLAAKAIAIGSSSVGLITNFFIFLFLVYFITPSLSRIRKYMENLSPLDNRIDKLYLDRTIAMTSTVIKGTFIVAIVQGMLGGLFMWLAGVDYVLTLTLAMIIASVIPLVGTGFITIPVAILLLLNGQMVPALIVFLGQIIVIANIDNIIRAELVSRESSLHPALMLISIFGGMQVFGIWGFIYGPVIMILFITSLEIYQKHIKY